MYDKGPETTFQKEIRGNEVILRDHICKTLNEINLERCKHIPKHIPGADWRVLLDVVEEDPSKKLFKVINFN